MTLTQKQISQLCILNTGVPRSFIIDFCESWECARNRVLNSGADLSKMNIVCIETENKSPCKNKN